MGVCRNCGSGEIDEDPYRGDSVCTKCGTVIENSIIVSRVEFSKDGGSGASQLIGQFVPSDSKSGLFHLGPGFRSASTIESRDLTIKAARDRTVVLCNRLGLKQNVIDSSVNFFKMALMRGITRGRPPEMVTAACSYLGARLENSPLTLVDFCDAMDTGDVYRLGKTFTAIASTLKIHLASPDPSMYVLRFASALNLGADANPVSVAAIRLINRMKSDYINAGRRPSGLCGAALLVACRFHGHNRTVSEIVKVVRVHHSTLRKRLLEFGDTPSSNLSLDEFMTVDLEGAEDPPSYCAARKKDRLLAETFNSADTVKTMTALQREIEQELEKSRHNKSFNLLKGSLDMKEMIMQSALEVAESVVEETELTAEQATELPPTFESLGCRSKSNVESTEEWQNPQIEIKDEDIEQYLLSPEEETVKRKSWFSMYGDYLKKEQERKRRLEEEGKVKKKKKINKKASFKGNHMENMEKVIQERKRSNKINYEVLKGLNFSLPPAIDEDDGATSALEPRKKKLKRPKAEDDKEMPLKKEKEVKFGEDEEEDDEDLLDEDEDLGNEANEDSVVALFRLHSQHQNDDGMGLDNEDDY